MRASLYRIRALSDRRRVAIRKRSGGSGKRGGTGRRRWWTRARDAAGLFRPFVTGSRRVIGPCPKALSARSLFFMPTPTVLWPSDVTTRGYLYGWDDLIIVVAGVLDVDTVSDRAASTLLLAFAQLYLQRDRAEQLLVSAGSDKRLELSGALPPTILGRCTHSASDSMPLLDLDGVRKDLSVVSYRRPSKDAMRFYSLGPIELDINSESHPRQRKSGLDPLSADYDFTINTPKAAPYFGSTVVDKVSLLYMPLRTLVLSIA